MQVAILFSGGKDSTFAIDYALERGWDIKYLLSIKPTRKDCYLFHFATVEHTPKLASAIGIKHYLRTCSVADPKLEAEIVKRFVEKHPVEALILGGTGLQETQIRSLQEALLPIGIEVFAAHSGEDHDELMIKMAEKGYKFMITQIASDGLDEKWLGRVLDEDAMQELFERAIDYGFHCGGEGGYYDTLVLDGPIFSKRLEVKSFRRVMEKENVGHVEIDRFDLVVKRKTFLR